MEIDRPFRIRIPSHKEPEKSNEGSVKPPEKTINQEFKEQFYDLQRDACDPGQAPGNAEKLCAAFEKHWEQKMADAKLEHCVQPMKDAVDKVRADEKPDITFAENMGPQFKITPEAMRRLAQHRTRADNEMDF